MTNLEVNLKIDPTNEDGYEHVSSFYFDVNIFTDKKQLQGHKLILARSSPWFNKYFQLREKMQICDIVFFNVSEKVVETAIDVLYGKEVAFPAKDKNKLTWFLTKLGVKWTDADDPIEFPNFPDDDNGSSSIFPPMKNQPGGSLLSGTTKKASDVIHQREQIPVKIVTTTEEDFFSILDEFSETTAEELAKIGHMHIGESGNITRSYKCLKCDSFSKFFTQAQKHHLEHEHDAFKDVRETLKNAELERKSNAKSISKIEKNIGKVEGKKSMKALRSG